MRDPAEEARLSDQLRTFGVTAERDGAPLYARLCQELATDAEVLGLLGGAPPLQRRPNLLLAAVHYLLLAGEDDPLADDYPTVVEWRSPGGDARRAEGDPADRFRSFCARHRERLAELLATRATQTNEVGRCAALLPALATVASRSDRPLALVDLGASAGLALLFDRYAYTYHLPAGRKRGAGDPGSTVRLVAEVREGRLPDLSLPPVTHRAGIDRDPADPGDADRSLWLLACQWPDHLGRFGRLRDALALARATPGRPRVEAGDMVNDLAAAARRAPADSRLCLTHSWAAAYLPPVRQKELAEAVTAVARDRPVSWVFAEQPYEVPGLEVPPSPGGRADGAATALVLVELADGRRRCARLADVHHHGRWIRWWGWPD